VQVRAIAATPFASIELVGRLLNASVAYQPQDSEPNLLLLCYYSQT
jgi:hypothetical protein